MSGAAETENPAAGRMKFNALRSSEESVDHSAVTPLRSGERAQLRTPIEL